MSNRDFYRPVGFWKAFKDYDGEPLNVREHQDAYEFFTRLQVRTTVPSAKSAVRSLCTACACALRTPQGCSFIC